MEDWVPLLHIFLKSPSPEAEASAWLHQTKPPLHPNHFLSLLLNPSSHHSNNTNRCIFIQNLPIAMQTRILSFLTTHHTKFSTRDLHSLATQILICNEQLSKIDFWVEKAARNLLDAICSKNSIQLTQPNQQELIPEWLNGYTTNNESLLDWLPLCSEGLSTSSANGVRPFVVNVEQVYEEAEDSNDFDGTGLFESDYVGLDPEIKCRASALKNKLLNLDSSSNVLCLVDEIRDMCFGSRGRIDPFEVLGLIKPWEADDETSSVLLSNLWSGNEGFEHWSSWVLSSVVLPKLLVLGEPASRVMVTAAIEFCKLHQRAAADALLFPLILRREGINTPLCDLLTRIIRECLHPVHVSAFCQKLLCGEEKDKRFVCLPCHRSLISDELVWTEPLFTLFQNILNQNIYLTQDSVDHLVSMFDAMVDGFSKSLKFGNLLLCLVTKCAPLLKFHKSSLIKSAERTDTFITKSVLSKLGGQ